MMDFNLTKDEQVLMSKIIERFTRILSIEFPKHQIDVPSTSMDLIACHKYGEALDLEKLLGSDRFTFLHDVCGISKYINRKTGQLTECFVPRCVKAKTEDAGVKV